MSHASPEFEVLDDLLAKLCEQGPSEALRQQISELLDGDPRAQQRYLEHLSLHADLLDPSGPLCGLGQPSAAIGPKDESGCGQFDWVIQLELESMLTKRAQRNKTNEPEVSLRLFDEYGRYLLGRMLTSRIACKAYAAAAVITLAAVLFFVFGGEDESPTPPLAGQRPGADTQIDRPAHTSAVVATLTAQHDAQWAEGALAPGSSLHPNQTLTLTAGFAEITTNDGAVAIIEAPATIELLNNDNAIHLHTGKLVGICETDSSKGFVVKTRHADITDLGTRFGVDATQADATRVHVLEGEVEVVGVSASGQTADEPKRLTAGHALQGDPSGGLISVAFEQSSFTQDVEHFSYRPQVQGHDAIWQGQASGDLSLHAREAEAVQLFIERKGVLLKRDTAVDLAGDRVWSKGSVPGQHTVEAGGRVDVYLLHLDPMRKQNVRGDYTVRFDRPILGVIAHQDTLVATDESLGAPGTTYPVITGRHAKIFNVSTETQRGLDIAMNDRAAITDGGTVLHVKSNAASVSDQVRVLVRAMQE